MIRRPPSSPLFPYPPLFRSQDVDAGDRRAVAVAAHAGERGGAQPARAPPDRAYHEAVVERARVRSEEHTSELQSPCNIVCRLLLEKKNKDSIARQTRAYTNT